jgi:hypothetical protein
VRFLVVRCGFLHYGEFRRSELFSDRGGLRYKPKTQERERFGIITLRYNDSPQVPTLLSPYVHKDVLNDFDGVKVLVNFAYRVGSDTLES